MTNLDTALALARAGHHVFPCHSGGTSVKRPMPGIFWGKDATNDEARIKQWWQKWPDAAPALSLGKSRLIVIDADRHGKQDGVEALGIIATEYGWDMSGVPVVATPNDGSHWYFRLPDGEKHGNAEGALKGSGINVRGDGGYVIAPGAILADGRQYELIGDISNPPVIFPWLLKLIKAGRADETPIVSALPILSPRPSQNAGLKAYVEQAMDSEFKAVASCGEGGRNIEVNRAAFSLGTMAGAGWISDSEIYATLENAAAQCGLIKDDGIVSVRKTIKSGLTAGRGFPRADLPQGDYERAVAHGAAIAATLIADASGTLHDPETGEIVEAGIPTAASRLPALQFPPGLVGRIASWITDTARVPQPALALGAALTVVGTVCGRWIKGPTENSTALFVLNLLATGKGKDHPLRCAIDIMVKSGMSHHIGPDHWKSDSALSDDIQQKVVMLALMDEFGDYMRKLFSKRASSHDQGIAKILRTAWGIGFDAMPGPSWRDQKSQLIYAPCISIFGASTHEQFYSALQGGAIEDGTLNRFLIIEGDSKAKKRSRVAARAGVPVDIIEGIKAIQQARGDITDHARYTSSDGSGSYLKSLPWCPDGSETVFTDYSDRIEQICEDDPGKADFMVRSPEMAVRIATIIAAGRGNPNVQRSDIEYAIAMVDQSAKWMMDGAQSYMAENEHEANVRKVLRAIRKYSRVKHETLLKNLKSIRARDLKEILQTLRESGEIHVIEIKTAGRPKIEYQWRGETE